MIGSEYEDILGDLPVRVFPQPRLVMDRHDEHSNLYVVKSGRIKLKVLPSGGRGLTLQYLQSGEQLGLLHRQDDTTSVTAEAAVDSEVYVIKPERQSELARRHSDWFFRAYRQLYRRMNDLWERYCRKNFYELPTQVLCVLCRLAQRFGTSGQEDIKLPDWLTIRDLADMTASSPASVYRCMSDLREEGLVDTESTFRLTDVEGLRSHVACHCGECPFQGSGCAGINS
jgi:CRP-like cAMP-binding protein